MVRKLYVGNLPYSATETNLKDLFGQFGIVESVKIVTDNFDGRSKGFGFVEMSTEEEANAAVSGLNGTELEGRSLKIDLARPKENNGGGRSPRPGGGMRRGPGMGGDRRGPRPMGGGNGERRNRW